MPKLVLTVHPNGTIETLLKDKIFDTRKLGHRSVERISEIRFLEPIQKFYVKWLKGPFAGVTAHDSVGSILFFDTYEDAVAYEVDEVNRMRLESVSFI